MARAEWPLLTTHTLVPRPLRGSAGRALSAVLRWLPAGSLLSELPARAKELPRAALEAARAGWPYMTSWVARSSARPPVEPLIPRDEPALPSSLDPARFQAHVASLRNPSAEIAVRAALSLRAFGPPAADPLREVLANLDGFCHPTVRAAAVQALGGLVPLKEGALFAEAAADPDVEVSLAAINALVARKDPLAVEVLLTVVENPSGFYVQATRLAAARGLRQLGVTGTSILGELCNTEANAEIREALAPLAS